MSIIEFLNIPIVQNGLSFILGGLVMKLIDIFITKDRDRRNRDIIAFDAIARKFISVIAREIAATDTDPDLSRLPNIEAAIIEFKPYLSDEKKKQIEETWEKYKTLEHNRATQVKVWGHATGSSKNKELLEELLKFTERHDKTSS